MSIAGPSLLARLKRLLTPSLFRYGVVGIIQNGAFYLFALGLIGLGWQTWQAVLVLNPIAVAASFLANRSWSFSGRAHDHGAVQLGRYLVVYGGGYVFAVSFSWLLERLGLPPWLALLATIGAAAVLLYAALNLWVFRQSSGRPAGGA